MSVPDVRPWGQEAPLEPRDGGTGEVVELYSGYVYNTHYMTSRDIIRRLVADGWVHVRIQGSHWQFRHPGRPNLVTVPHPRKDLPAGTVRAIFKQAGWSKV
jgi:predicted RNA binding protein YcfA (HicA-like mRNA interferase family)